MRRIFSKQNRALLAELVRTDFKLRYQASVLGYLWSLLRPLLIFLILYVVFVKFLKLGTGIPHYPVYLLLGIVIWNFFYEMTMQSTGSIVLRGELIRKIKIPRWIIPVSTSLSALINFALNLLVVIVFIIFSHVSVSSSALYFPLLIVEMYLFSLFVSLFLSAVFVRFRDISYIWEVILQGGFYLTPILYPLSRIHSVLLQKFLLINPVAQIMQDARYSIITHDTLTVHKIFHGGPDDLIPFAIIIVSGLIGVSYFRKESKYFAENV